MWVLLALLILFIVSLLLSGNDSYVGERADPKTNPPPVRFINKEKIK
jgi:hypothetical protein